MDHLGLIPYHLCGFSHQLVHSGVDWYKCAWLVVWPGRQAGAGHFPLPPVDSGWKGGGLGQGDMGSGCGFILYTQCMVCLRGLPFFPFSLPSDNGMGLIVIILPIVPATIPAYHHRTAISLPLPQPSHYSPGIFLPALPPPPLPFCWHAAWHACLHHLPCYSAGYCLVLYLQVVVVCTTWTFFLPPCRQKTPADMGWFVPCHTLAFGLVSFHDGLLCRLYLPRFLPTAQALPPTISLVDLDGSPSHRHHLMPCGFFALPLLPDGRLVDTLRIHMAFLFCPIHLILCHWFPPLCLY